MVERFVRERDWNQFHTPKNLSVGMAVEAAELMELFQWHDADGSAALMRQTRTRRAAGEEVADVMIYCLAFGSVYGLVSVVGFFQVPAVVRMLNLNMADNFLHLAIAVACLWVGGQSKGK